MRIVTMNKHELEQNPIPSHITIDSYELYVTYSGQNLTCRYCGEVGHVQTECKNKQNDFPCLDKRSFSPTLHIRIETNQAMQARNYVKEQQSADRSVSESNNLINCSNPKKRKLLTENDSSFENDRIIDSSIPNEQSEIQTIHQIFNMDSNVTMTQNDSKNFSHDMNEETLSSTEE